MAAARKKVVRVNQTPSLMKVKRTSIIPAAANVANVRRSFVITQLDPTDLTQEEGFICSFKKIFDFLRRKKVEYYTPKELEDKIVKLHKYCLTHLVDSYRVHLNRLKGVALIEEIVERANFVDLKPSYVARLIWSTISCVHHFYIRLRATKGPMDWSRRRQARNAISVYEKLVTFIQPDLFAMSLQAILTFFCDAHVWVIENFCAEILKRFIYSNEQADSIVEQMLNLMEKTLTKNVKESRQVLRVLYEVMVNYSWTDIDEEVLVRLLTMYYHSIHPTQDDEFFYPPVRKGLELLLRAMFQNFPSTYLMKSVKLMLSWVFDDTQTDEAFLDFGNTIEYAALLHNTQNYKESLTPDVFPSVLRLIASENFLHSLLGQRVLQHLLDRRGNLSQFSTPQIFYDKSLYGVEVATYNSDDKYFIRRYREVIHSILLDAVQKHGEHRVYLENIFTTIALIVVEVPCGYTAAAVVCLAMAIQEYTINDDRINLDAAHRIHATVLSIMSLVCWVHHAQMFYDYLNEITSRRAELAPHLNPPLKPTYSYAQHHILWNKPDLFFEDWEVRYGLWKCFRSRRKGLTNAEEKKT